MVGPMGMVSASAEADVMDHVKPGIGSIGVVRARYVPDG
jgi:hypothetical protein